MIQVKEFPNRSFENNEDLFRSLKENKQLLISKKKSTVKECDSVLLTSYIDSEKDLSGVKNESQILNDLNKIRVKVIINTTNLMDSHSDVHLKGIWKKSVRESKNLYHIQEHQMTFDKVISDKVKVSVESIDWKDLGVDYKGKTEALVFDSIIEKARNPFMFNQYSNGYVKEHSVGMRYIKLELALNSENPHDKEEKEIWDKYIDQVANKEEAIAQGFFWAVQEAKIIEGSAVVKGSNPITPTREVEAVSDNTSSNKESLKSTQTIESFIKQQKFI